jgi:cation diffusion facilitator CzcD-associated flavoprotein CzcO
MYEHPDFPMDEKRFGVQKGQHIPAEKMFEYLTAFIEKTRISSFLRLNTRVEVVEKNDEGWRLQCTSSAEKTYVVTATKLIIAVGLTNKPKMPKYPNTAGFEPPVMHSTNFPAQYSKVVKPDKHTLIVGGGKSAWDVAYACATQPNASVTILIRPSGNGPNWMSPSHVTPFKLWLEKLVFTRFFGCKYLSLYSKMHANIAKSCPPVHGREQQAQKVGSANSSTVHGSVNKSSEHSGKYSATT